ncbi:hypothetical protein WH299_03655 [Pseudomonas sp. MYb541]|uniref:hypothetical protein n=1 Tax=Pseudomonas sp. MYb541 TaxID=2745402 RepID=UPI003094CB9D
MSKPTQLTVSTQLPITVDAWNSTEYLALSPELQQRLFLPNGDNQYITVSGLDTGFTGGHYSTAVKSNQHGRDFLYVTESATLTATGASTHCSISIEKNGKDATYTSTTPDASVTPFTVLFEEYVGGVRLTINPGNNVGQLKQQTSPPIATHGVYSFDENTQEIKPLSSTIGSASKTFSNKEPFSQLNTASIYYEKPIYQLQPDNYVAIDKLIQNAFGTVGGYYSLTGDSANLYPAGVTQLTFKDGYSDNYATIEFYNNTTKGEVTVTILSHNYRRCEIRDIQTEFLNFPNTLCFAV